MKNLIVAVSTLVCICLSGCTTANSYYTKHETVGVEIKLGAPPAKATVRALPIVAAAAAGYALQIAGNVVANQVAKEQAKYTAQWDGTGEEPKDASALSSNPITDLTNYHVLVQRFATRSEDDATFAAAPQAVTTLVFEVVSLAPNGAYRLKLADVDYRKSKAKIAKPVFLIGGSPLQKIDVKIDLNLQAYGFSVEKDKKGHQTPDTKTLLATTISLKQVDPGSDFNPRWVSPIFDIPEHFEIRKLFCAIAVTESSAASFYYTLADKDHIGDLTDAIKAAAGLAK